MEGVFVLSDYSEFLKEISNQIGLPEEQVISVPLPAYDSEYKWHNWVNNIFKEHSIKKLVIPISLPTDSPNNLGLIIAMHIRLNYEVSLKERLVPIVFLSDLELGNIFKLNELDSDYNPQHLLLSKGVVLSNFDSETIINYINNIEAVNASDYKLQVLNKLKVLQKTNEGKHSIANAWGCYKLALVTGLGEEIFKETIIANKLKTLYAKYLICENDVFSTSKYFDLNPLECLNKKILFIDDRADDGWAIIMKNIFKNAGADFVYVESSKYKNEETQTFHDFNGFYEECQSHIGKDWDLIIIDLRLHPENEDIDNDIMIPSEFSGYKLMDEFLKKNEGYQIIVSTASNKIWNINVALNRGVSSYYIKESPEFNYSIKETKKTYENFKDEVINCFEKNYLREIYKEIQELTEVLDKMNHQSDFSETLKTQLNLSYLLLKEANSQEQFAYAFVSLYMIIEIINNQFIEKTAEGEWKLENAGIPLLDWTYDQNGKRYINSNSPVIGDKPPEWQKVAGLYFQEWKGEDSRIIQQLYFLITKRNAFVHNNKEVLNKTRKDKNENDIKDRDGNLIYLNHDIYEAKGFIKLFDIIKKIIHFL